MRIVSLLPSATDIVFSLGLGENLVGRTHECDWPAGVASVPVMTKDALATASMETREIHEAISESLHRGSSIYQLDPEALKAAKPDIVLTQELCEVCAVSYSQVRSAVRLLDADAAIVSLEPRTVDEILETISVVGELAGVPTRAEAIVDQLRARLDRIRIQVGALPRPRVASIEWLDPLFSAGHWVPEQVAIGGGEEIVGSPGEPSAEIDWESVVREEPEVLVLMPCGHAIERTEADLSLLARRQGWSVLLAVQRGEVWAVDGPAHFNRPGPRVVRGAEVLAGVFHGAFEFTPAEARRLL